MAIIKIFLKKNEGFNLAAPDFNLNGDYDIGFEENASVIFSNQYKPSETIFIGPTSEVIILKEETKRDH